MSKKTWFYPFSILRLLACFGIIVLHTAYQAVLQYNGTITDGQKFGALAVTNCLTWAVPCFVMITGALLLDPTRELTLKKLFSKYLLRVVGALVLFVLLYRLFDMATGVVPATGVSFLEAFKQLYTATSWSPLWYLYMLIGLYLLLPFYKKIAAHSSEKELRYLLLIYLVFLSLLSLTELANVASGFYIHVSTIYPFYLFLGYAIHTGAIRIPRPVSVLLILVGTVGIVLGTKYVLDSGNTAVTMLWKYNSILVILQSAGLFSLFDSEKAGERELRFLKELDLCTFGVYLIHIILVKYAWAVLGLNPFEKGYLFPVVVLAVTVISFLVTWVLRKIPGLKQIL